MTFRSTENQNSEGKIRGVKDPTKRTMKKMRSIKLQNSSSRRSTRQYDSAIDHFSTESKMNNFEVDSEYEDTSPSSSNSKSKLDQTADNSTPRDPTHSKKSTLTDRKISKPNFTRTPSLRSVRILKSRASFKSQKSLMKKQREVSKDLNVVRATCSSTLKDSKFCKKIDTLEGERKVEKISALKVCPYHHCSLYGHHHGSEPVEKKVFLRRKTSPKQIQKSKKRENEERVECEMAHYEKSVYENVSDESDLAVEKEWNDSSSAGKSEENGGGDAIKNLVGKKSPEEKNSQENEVCVIFPDNEYKDSGEIIFQPEKISQIIETETAEKISQKESSISMWQLIHRQMVSSLNEDHDDLNQVRDLKSYSDSRSNLSKKILASDMTSEETEIRKSFAVNLVREAFEKILLPEVQDQSSANQPISKEESLKGENSMHNEISEQQSSDDREEKKDNFTDERAPKSWSYLKKVILLKRFVKELERVSEFKLKKVQSRPLDLDQEEVENISLRRQTTNAKRNSEEWMLDYAIQKVLSELAPNQKKKVLLLVRAFETVAPSQDDQLIHENFSIIKGSNHQDLESNEDDNVVLSSNSLEVTTKNEEICDSIYEGNKAQMNDTECDNESSKVRVKRANSIGMWRLIHSQMILGLEAESVVADKEKVPDDVCMTSASNGAESEETKMRKSFAINLVREAIEKILLPEVQDHSFNDQQTTSTFSSHQDLNEKNSDEDFGKSKENSEETEENISEKQKPKSWSYLKKVILLKRFVKELEKVKKFNPRNPNYLPVVPDEEPEKVKLRPQTVSKRRNTEEWMLDYAIQHVVSQLTPTQKEKVALLVKAFETVAPPKETSPKIVSRSKDDVISNLSGSFEETKNVKAFETVAPPKETSPKIVSRSKDDVADIKSNLSGSFEETKNEKVGVEKQNKIKMWHMIYQHVVSGVAEKVVTDEEFDDKSNAVKLVQEAVDEILNDSSDNQSHAIDIVNPAEGETEPAISNKKRKNWSKLKNLMLMKRSIKALGDVTKRSVHPLGDEMAREEVNLKSQIVDERKKAEQWMLDYAVQHIVTKLTPARKRRVAMLVEAFEAVIPLPQE